MQFLRVDEVIKRVRVSRSKLYAMISSGDFPRPSKIGNLSVWLEDDISEWQKKIIGGNNA